MEQKFLYCKHCGKVLIPGVDRDTPTICCGEEMVILKANSTDAAQEKHDPVVKFTDNKIEVAVGSVLHPMTPEHFIQFIYLQTEKGGQLKKLNPGDEPKAVFLIGEDKPLVVYEFCNLHGLWKADVK